MDQSELISAIPLPVVQSYATSLGGEYRESFEGGLRKGMEDAGLPEANIQQHIDELDELFSLLHFGFESAKVACEQLIPLPLSKDLVVRIGGEVKWAGLETAALYSLVSDTDRQNNVVQVYEIEREQPDMHFPFVRYLHEGILTVPSSEGWFDVIIQAFLQHPFSCLDQFPVRQFTRTGDKIMVAFGCSNLPYELGFLFHLDGFLKHRELVSGR
jgi:hypothetical protein